MSVECELQGISELLNKFDELAIKSNVAQANGLNEAGDILTNEVKNTDKFEDRTGKLRASIKKSGIKTSKKVKFVWVGDVDGLTDYSWFVEYGRNGKTGYVPPTAFLRGTTEENRERLKSVMIHELRKGLGI